MEYFLILVALLLVAVFLQRKLKFRIYHSINEMVVMVGTVFLIGVVWDYFATYRNHWVFPGSGLLGLRIYGLPIEEFMFFLIIPYFTLVLYKTFSVKLRQEK